MSDPTWSCRRVEKLSRIHARRSRSLENQNQEMPWRSVEPFGADEPPHVLPALGDVLHEITGIVGNFHEIVFHRGLPGWRGGGTAARWSRLARPARSPIRGARRLARPPSWAGDPSFIGCRGRRSCRNASWFRSPDSWAIVPGHMPTRLRAEAFCDQPPPSMIFRPIRNRPFHPGSNGGFAGSTVPAPSQV